MVKIVAVEDTAILTQLNKMTQRRQVAVATVSVLRVIKSRLFKPTTSFIGGFFSVLGHLR